MLLPPRDLTAYEKLLVLALVLALLVGNAAAGLASRLARGLALAAAAILGALAQIPGLQGLDMSHGFLLHLLLIFGLRIPRNRAKVKKEGKTNCFS